MDIKKKIKVLNVCTWITTITAIAIVIYGLLTSNSSWVWYLLISVAVFLILDIWISREKSKIDPLNLKRQGKAIKYAKSVKSGLKNQFIAETSEEMYQHFLKCGYIHELFNSDDVCVSAINPVWQITTLGYNFEQSL